WWSFRFGLGAGRARLVRQVLTESLILSAAGGVAGVILSIWGTDLLVSLGPRNLPRLHEVGIDLRVLLYAAAVSILSGVLFGLAPAIRASRPKLALTLETGARGTTDR